MNRDKLICIQALMPNLRRICDCFCTRLPFSFFSFSSFSCSRIAVITAPVLLVTLHFDTSNEPQQPEDGLN